MKLHPYIGIRAIANAGQCTPAIAGIIVAVGQYTDNDGSDVMAWIQLPDGNIKARALDTVRVDHAEVTARLAGW